MRFLPLVMILLSLFMQEEEMKKKTQSHLKDSQVRFHSTESVAETNPLSSSPPLGAEANDEAPATAPSVSQRPTQCSRRSASISLLRGSDALHAAPSSLPPDPSVVISPSLALSPADAAVQNATGSSPSHAELATSSPSSSSSSSSAVSSAPSGAGGHLRYCSLIVERHSLITESFNAFQEMFGFRFALVLLFPSSRFLLWMVDLVLLS